MNMKVTTNANDHAIKHTKSVKFTPKDDVSITEIKSNYVEFQTHSPDSKIDDPMYMENSNLNHCAPTSANRCTDVSDNEEHEYESFDGDLRSLSPSDILFDESTGTYFSDFKILPPQPPCQSDKDKLTKLVLDTIYECSKEGSDLPLENLAQSISSTGNVPFEFLQKLAKASNPNYNGANTPDFVEAMFATMMDDINLSGEPVKEQGLFDRFQKDVIDDVLEGVEEKHGLMSEIKGLLDSVKDTNEKLNNLSIESILSTITSSRTVKTVTHKATRGLMSILVFAGMAILYKWEPSHTNLALLVMSFCSMLYFTNLLGGIAQALKGLSLFKTTLVSDVVKEQNATQGVIGIITFLFGCHFNSYYMPTAMIFKSLSALTSTKRGVTEIYDGLVSIVESIVNHVRVQYLGKEKLAILGGQLAEVDFYIRQVQDIMDRENLCTFLKTTENYLLLESLRNEGAVLLNSLKTDPKTNNAIVMLRGAHSNICKLMKDFQARNISSAGNRQEPVGVVLQGGSGVGKSMLMEHICSAFCASTLTLEQMKAYNENRKNYIFNYQGESSYFDGYQPTTHVTYFDEMFQAKDTDSKPDAEPMTLVRMLNSFEMALNFAKLEMKGNVKFHSKLVIGTTNMKEFKFNSIIDSEAVIRRLHIQVIVVPKPEYCKNPKVDYWNRRFDYDKIDGAAHYKHQEYYTAVDGKAIGEPFDFDTLMVKILELYSDKKRFHLDNLKAFQETQDRYMKMRNDYMLEMFPLPKEQSISFALKSKLVQNEHAADIELFGSQIDVTIQRIVNLISEDGPNAYVKRMKLLNSAMELIYTEDSLRKFSNMDKIAIFCEDAGVDALDIFKYCDFHRYTTDEVIDSIELNGKLTAELPRMEYTLLSDKSYFTAFMENCEDFGYSNIVSKLKESSGWITTLCYIGAALAGTSLVIGLIKLFIPDYKATEESMGASDKMRSTKTKVDLTKGSAALKAALLSKEQGGEFDSNGSDIALSVLSSNSFFIYIGDTFLGSILFVKGRVAVMPMHYIRKILNRCEDDPEFLKTVVYLRKSPHDARVLRDVELVCSVKDLVEGMEFSEYSISQDFCFVEFPRQISEKRNIIPYFLLEKDLTRFEHNIHFILGDGAMRQTRGLAKEHSGVVVESEDGTTTTVAHSYTYMASTAEGSCGSVFFVLNPSVEKRKIAGIHIAGHATGWGFSTVLTQEVIDAHLTAYKSLVDCVESEHVAIEQSSNFPYTQISQIGVSKRNFTVGSKSSIIRSPIYNKYDFKPVTMPTKVRPFFVDGEEINPVQLAMSKFVYPKQYIDVNKLCRIRDSYYDFLEHNCHTPVERRLLTYDEVLNGSTIDSDINGINLSTSSGFTMKCAKQDFKKILHSLPRESAEYAVYSKIVFDECDAIIDLYKQNIRPFFVYMICPKDERKEIEKVLKGKLRLFAACEFEYQIVFWKYFGSFFISMKKNRIDNHSGVGINPYSEEWTKLAMKLCQFDPTPSLAKVGAGDYSHFDGSASEQIHYAILDVINRWYSDGNENIRYLIWQEIANSRQLIENVVAQFCGSMPSGNPATTYINIMYNEFAFRLCWVDMNLPLFEFDSHIYVIFYGDDNAFSVHPCYRHIFNEISLVDSMAKIGLEYTTELKLAATIPFRNLEDIEFIKRSFSYDRLSTLWLAPLRLDVVLEIPCWTKRKDSLNIVTDNVTTTIRELSLHPKEVFEEWTPKIIKAYKDFIPFATSSTTWSTSHSLNREVVSKAEYAFN
jgi:hypothetical protein